MTMRLLSLVQCVALTGAVGAFVSLGVSACSSNTASPDAGTTEPTVSWTTVYGEVITQCTDHHSGGATAAGNLDLSTQSNAYQNLVNVVAQGSACGVAGLDGGTPLLRVAPKNSGESLLYQKLEGTQNCGATMPDQSNVLPASQLALVKEWIDEGAPNN